MNGCIPTVDAKFSLQRADDVPKNNPVVGIRIHSIRVRRQPLLLLQHTGCVCVCDAIGRAASTIFAVDVTGQSDPTVADAPDSQAANLNGRRARREQRCHAVYHCFDLVVLSSSLASSSSSSSTSSSIHIGSTVVAIERAGV